MKTFLKQRKIWKTKESEVNIIKTERITYELFRNGGRLSKHFLQYQYRKDQTDMALIIAKGLENNKTSIVEAGTGTGKSFAELVPTLAHVLSENKNSNK